MGTGASGVQFITNLSRHGISVPELEPRLFSFNAPQGACATCNGIGWLEDFDFSMAIDPEHTYGGATDGKLRLQAYLGLCFVKWPGLGIDRPP